MAVHGWACIRSILPCVSKLPGHHASKLHILAAATPLPSLTRGALVACVTSADGGWTLCAGTGHRKCHSRRGNRMNKCWLSSGWKENYTYLWDIERWKNTGRQHLAEKHLTWVMILIMLMITFCIKQKGCNILWWRIYVLIARKCRSLPVIWISCVQSCIIALANISQPKLTRQLQT